MLEGGCARDPVALLRSTFGYLFSSFVLSYLSFSALPRECRIVLLARAAIIGGVCVGGDGGDGSVL